MISRLTTPTCQHSGSRPAKSPAVDSRFAMISRLALFAVMWMAAPFGAVRRSSRRGQSRIAFCSAATTSSASTTASTSRPSSALGAAENNGATKTMRLLHVQIVHRHGDRTPITPLLDEAFWASQLVPPETLTKIGAGTRVLRDDETSTAGGATASHRKHGAQGRGPFGQLTRLGLLQMIQVGTSIRERYSSDSSQESADEASDRLKLWTPSRPIRPNHLKVYSTDFSRTLQSVQGLLVGLLPEDHRSDAAEGGAADGAVVEIDARHTNIMIPDPQPRNSDEQVMLERELAGRAAAAQVEAAMLPLARRVTALIQPLLAPSAHEISFGVSGEGDAPRRRSGSSDADEDGEEPPEEIEVQPLSWNQLAEVCKCLSVYDRLPPGLDVDDVDRVLTFAGQRWFDTLRNPRLAHLATSEFVQRQLDVFCRHPTSSTSSDATTLMTIWSAHDASIVGLLCAYRIVRGSEWPGYASHLAIELFEDERTGERHVRFSMNGEPLPCRWESDAEPRESIPLAQLVDNVKRYTGVEEPAVALHTSAT